MGEVFFFKNYHLATGFRSRLIFFFFFFFTPQVSEVLFVCLFVGVFVCLFVCCFVLFFSETSIPPSDIKWCVPNHRICAQSDI